MADDPRPKPVIQPQRPQPKATGAFVMLTALVGVGTATAVLQDTKQDEGVIYRAYPDLGGVWSICSGSTHGVNPGEVDTGEQCDARTSADLLKSATIVLRCAPDLKGHHNQLRAAIRFQNNTGKFCASSGGRLMAQGRFKAGCDALLAYNGIVSVGKPIRGSLTVRRLKNDAQGRPRFFNVFRGLKNRRDHEHAICIQGV